MNGQMALVDFWDVDPLPVFLAPYGSMKWWRLYSAFTLEARREL